MENLGNIGGISTLVLILVLSFAIDRFTKATLFLLSFVKRWATWAPDPLIVSDEIERVEAAKKQTLIRHVFAGILGLIVIALWGNVRVLQAVGYQATWAVDVLATTVVFVGGSDIVDKLLQASGLSGGTSSGGGSQPIEITGRLVLEQGRPPQAGEGVSSSTPPVESA